MNRLLSLAFASIFPLFLTACTIYGSKVTDKTSINSGQFYMLPKALVPITVTVSTTSMAIEVLDPVYVGDANYQFAFNPNINWFSSDTGKISVDPRTSLLKSVVVTSKDETVDVLKEVIAFAAAEAAPIPSNSVIQSLIDPENFDGAQKRDLEREVNNAIERFFALTCPSAKSSDGATDAVKPSDATGADVSKKSNLPECALYEAKNKEPGFSISLRPVAGNSSASLARATDLGSCNVGLCHKGTIPYELRATLLGNTKVSLINLPNGAPIMSLALDRAPFVQIKHTVTLQNGIVSDYERDRPSSSLALAKAPLQIAGGVADVIGKVIQLRIDTSKAEVNLLEQQLAEETRRREIAEKFETLKEDQKKESAALGAPPGRVLVMAVGSPPVGTVADFSNVTNRSGAIVQPVVDSTSDDVNRNIQKDRPSHPSSDGSGSDENINKN